LLTLSLPFIRVALLFNSYQNLLMKLNFLFQTLAAALTIFCLSSCDGGGGGSAEVPFLTDVPQDDAPKPPKSSARYPDNLIPNALALFPDILVTNPTDRFELTPVSFSVPQIPFPTTDGEIDGVILPFAATSVVSDSQTYRYNDNGTTAQLILSAPLVDGRGTSNPSSYIDGLVNLLNFSGGSSDGLFKRINDILLDLDNQFWFASRGEALPEANLPGGRPTVAEMRELIGVFGAADELAARLRDITGYIGVDNPGAVGQAGFELEIDDQQNRFTLVEVHVPVENFMVLSGRTITLENTNSNNETLLIDEKISGDYIIDDNYSVVFFTAEVNTGFTLTAATGGEKPADEIYEDAISPVIISSANGDFTFKLGSLFASD
jgi:hypothetical protein